MQQHKTAVGIGKVRGNHAFQLRPGNVAVVFRFVILGAIEPEKRALGDNRAILVQTFPMPFKESNVSVATVPAETSVNREGALFSFENNVRNDWNAHRVGDIDTLPFQRGN